MFICRFCTKTYKRKGCYEKHEIVCEHRSHSSASARVTTLSHQELCELLVISVKRINDLENKVSALQNTSRANQQNICLELLSKQINPKHTYHHYFHTLLITVDDLEYIWRGDFIKGVNDILSRFMSSSTPSLPIASFTNKQNTLYVYDGNDWKIADVTHMTRIIQILQDKLLRLFNQWTKTNTLEQQSNYGEYTRQVLGLNNTPSEVQSRVKKHLYHLLKS